MSHQREAISADRCAKVLEDIGCRQEGKEKNDIGITQDSRRGTKK